MTMKRSTLKWMAVLAVASAPLLAACSTTDSTAETSEMDNTVVVSPGAPPPPPPPPPPPMVRPAPAPPAVYPMQRQQAQGITGGSASYIPAPEMVVTERYEDVDANPVHLTREDPVSTFSIDVDTASYAVMRRHLTQGQLPPTDAIRIEEMINYFDYDYPLPEVDSAPFEPSVTITPNPWASDRQLMHVAIQGYDIEPEERPAVNLTLLIDVSGSMGAPNKLPLAKEAMGLLLEQLDDRDTVSIAVYAGAAGEVLAPTPASKRDTIMSALDNLSAGGSTAGGAGIALAYDMAQRSFIEDGVNRVMLITDGDFNVGVTRDESLEDFVARKRESGIYLSVFGVGSGNYNDALMQKIAQVGNGTAGYVDTIGEARKLLVDDLSSNLFPIADDVKIQVEFNPAQIAEYRLIGYETRMLNREDFNNDAVDAGDIGAGASVTAIYDITPVGSEGSQIDPLRYGDMVTPTSGDTSKDFAFVKIRYKPVGEDDSILLTRPVGPMDAVTDMGEASASTQWAVAVAGFGQLLSQGTHIGQEFDYYDVLDLATDSMGHDPFGYRAEFLLLVEIAQGLAEANDRQPE